MTFVVFASQRWEGGGRRFWWPPACEGFGTAPRPLADMAPAGAGLARRGDSLCQPRPSPGSRLGCRGHLLEGGF